jgi:hypothetical protein
MSEVCFDRPDREGFALVTALLIILVLSVIAVAAIIIATTEKQTTVAESAHAAAVFSADAGGEAGIHFLRMSSAPPMIIDFSDSTVVAPTTAGLQDMQTYEFTCWFAGSGRRPGWDANYIDRTYRVQSTGQAAAGGRSDVRLLVTRTFKEGY